MKYAPRRESASTRRAKSSRATEQGVAGHQAAMKALGSAVISTMGDPAHFVKPESVRSPDSRGSKIAKQRAKGLLTDGEANQERTEVAIKDYVDNGKDTFEKGLMKPVAQYQKEKDK